jgi:hypothetical protein
MAAMIDRQFLRKPFEHAVARRPMKRLSPFVANSIRHLIRQTKAQTKQQMASARGTARSNMSTARSARRALREAVRTSQSVALNLGSQEIDDHGAFEIARALTDTPMDETDQVYRV